MSTPTRIIVLVGAMLAVAGIVAALSVHGDAKPVGSLSCSDVREIRAVVMRAEAPGWSWFTRANLRAWPTLVRMRLTFRIAGIREASIGFSTVYANGTSEESSHPVVVRFRAYGRPEGSCRVERKNGRWMIAPLQSSESPLLLFLPSNPPGAGNAGHMLLSAIGPHRGGLPDQDRWTSELSTSAYTKMDRNGVH